MRRPVRERLSTAAIAAVRRGCGCANACGGEARSYDVLRGEGSNVEVRAWIRGVEVERSAHEQLLQLSRMGEVIRHPIAVMPDVHTGQGATVGTVIPTTNALIPASVGVDIGCGMIAAKTTLTPEDLPGSLAELRLAIEVAVPHGRTHNGRSGLDAGSWRGDIPKNVADIWNTHLRRDFEEICATQRAIEASNHVSHLGTLGSGNHFIELCIDDAQHPYVWVMLHSGSRGVGNRIGTIFIELAKKDMGNHLTHLPSADLAYLREGSPHFDQYVKAVDWAQRYAKWNREIMLQNVLQAMRSCLPKPFSVGAMVINCHHNYVERVELDPHNCVWLTRKGATSARGGELAVIPGSMGAKSYIVRGKGSPLSYASCSHGAGRRYSRGEARRRFTLEDHEAATADVECRKDADVLDETPLAYKKIDEVMQAQEDLVEVVCALKQVLCVKG
ncbi:tRNA-splicing ligase RtcB [Trypanosoma conorhini]|uniref:3'-phosphate/5'-hydroxy nucleic acid ligase n=1 Tax=Trypanosoma conorhini TaxID=83891 RepID=A0A422PGJ9_9TRYP|nr:tRNA-splicing ligase RtcB [Trypanosoma conorhini]RNF16827.1 tRNA-splicing ligase RtcB [Trypanosoma conorhini]